jgi:Helix-turn-helix domain
MPRGRKTALSVQLTPAQRQTLLAWQRSTAIPAGLARRGRMVLLLAEGMTITDIATTVGIHRRFVYKWVRRFLAEGVAGLYDKPGPSRRLGQLPQSVSDQPHNLDVG